jgi:hypothetical protein
VDRLRELAARELAENREFKRLVADLKAPARQSPVPNQPTLAAQAEQK